MGTNDRNHPAGIGTACPWRATLLGGFALSSRGGLIRLPRSAERLFALLVLARRPLLRPFVAGTLWPDRPETQARSSLRSCLWRLERETGLIEASRDRIGLTAAASADVWELEESAEALIDGGAANLGRCLELLLAGDLLQDWYEEWVGLERDRVHELRVRALEALTERLIARGAHARATQAALAAIQLEPLRESAHRALIRAYLAEGNRSSALVHYQHLRRLLLDELGIEPSVGIHDMAPALASGV
jgi:DNA-binding SARP family transcriptional activator